MFSITSAGKGPHEMRMSSLEVEEHRKQRGFINVCECSRRRLREW